MSVACADPDLQAWLGLVLVPRLGPVKARRLLSALGSPQAVLAAPASVWADVLGQRWAAAACQPPQPRWDQQWQATQAWLAGADRVPGMPSAPRACLTLADAAYPKALLNTEDPPLLLFAQGRLELLDRPALAMVGSRHATPQGLDNARAFAHALSEAGVTIVSGLAEGIDAAAHQGALQSRLQHLEQAQTQSADAVGSTVAVVGTGLDVVYPASHKALARDVATHGLMLSEFVLGTEPQANHFPRRNRIVAGLSQATLVVEAALLSGSLITARLAAELGRDVMAIPGSIHSPQSRGCHALIKQGAKLVETAQDVLEELPALPRGGAAVHVQTSAQPDLPPAASQGAAEADPVLRALGFDPVNQEALSARTGMGPAELGARLLELELTGQVVRLPGLRFQRMAHA